MRLTIASLLLLTILAACSRPSGPPGTPLRLNPAFGDLSPTDWGAGPAPQRYAIHGIDISRWQRGIDWNRAHEAGISFAFVKATEGGDMIDPAFPGHWEGAGKAGIARGAYHFYYFCRSAEDQARWFIRNVPRDPDMLPPVLDMEWNPFSPTCTYRPPAETVQAEARKFIEIVSRHYGKRPIIYTTPDFYEQTGIGQVDATFWLRAVAEHPREIYQGQDWAFWQYTGTGIVPGIPGGVDINVFSGSPAEWSRFTTR
ncbi:GH25 family lysozyme [Palleronia sp. LCG004]|uniref:glycoside hydrolase family 25 protein n=1 Tax=Palleronia sp. LCG004 TaxID=3079304 RepID=UPI002943319D|nr:GH25 family lysozyme [Palleronia sp. LCG004]WOI55483.1 GH25 family lysozyme [Palleronia sp. LCG004]